MLLRLKKPAALVLLLSVTACTSLQPVIEPNGYVARKNPSFVVITTVNENEDPIVLTRPQVQGNTLTGTFEGEPVTFPMMNIRTVQAVQPDRKKTMFAILGGVVSVGLVTYLMVGNGTRIDRSPVCVPEGTRSDLPYC
jgi:hypothetical protein